MVGVALVGGCYTVAMNEVSDFLIRIEQAILNPIITLISLAAFLYFIWGVVQFIQAGATGGEMKEDGKRHMLWGIIGLAIIFGARAILAIIARSAGL